MAIPWKDSNSSSCSHGFVVIARNARGQIITRITSRRDFVGAMGTARSVLKLKLDAVRVEVHHGEGPASEYRGKPLAVVTHEDVQIEQRSM